MNEKRCKIRHEGGEELPKHHPLAVEVRVAVLRDLLQRGEGDQQHARVPRLVCLVDESIRLFPMGGEKMGRSSGYRARAENREEVEELRAKLATLQSYEWQKASIVMDQITTLLGYTGGPSHCSIQPRACRYCQYYGHTRQHCKRKKRDEEREVERMIMQHKRERMNVEVKKEVKLPWWQRATQEEWFDELGIKYYYDSDQWYMGPVIRTVKIADE